MKSLLGLISLILGTNSGAAPTTAAPSSDVNRSNVVIIDVRTPQEFGQGHVNKSLNIDFLNDSFKNQISKLDRNKLYGLYCRSGNRSGQALKLMKQMGFTQVENLGSLEEARRALTSGWPR